MNCDGSMLNRRMVWLAASFLFPELAVRGLSTNTTIHVGNRVLNGRIMKPNSRPV